MRPARLAASTHPLHRTSAGTMEADLPLVHAVAAAQATELSQITDLTADDADLFHGFEADPWSAVGQTVIVPKAGMPQAVAPHEFNAEVVSEGEEAGEEAEEAEEEGGDEGRVTEAVAIPFACAATALAATADYSD